MNGETNWVLTFCGVVIMLCMVVIAMGFIRMVGEMEHFGVTLMEIQNLLVRGMGGAGLP